MIWKIRAQILKFSTLIYNQINEFQMDYFFALLLNDVYTNIFLYWSCLKIKNGTNKTNSKNQIKQN
jgi:hypothetical protein